MKRMIDKHAYTYSVYAVSKSGIYVKCPKCGNLAIITADDNTACCKCTKCGFSKQKKHVMYHYDVHNQCKGCGRYYRVDITEEKQQHVHVLRVACPFCGYAMSGEVRKTAKMIYYRGEIRNACEPFFGCELWFLTYFCEKPVWALNRAHLAYLIDYLSADLREKPADSKMMMTQADFLPAFMKTAKHRNKIVKLLTNMQNK
ncbi:MAG: hypothetical protein K2N61_01085 [Lachnospiraceae bacterium]|nr:hypothetical protein [Lachnospiraceae bacterium]MDE7307250.1 hypothetical protein [Lachnospiraceae bacterium]